MWSWFKMKNHKEEAIELVETQFAEAVPVSQELLDQMIDANASSPNATETADELRDSIEVGVSKFIYFTMTDGDDTNILKIPAKSVDEAVATLENIGSFIDAENSPIPRLRQKT
jgi:hypothetical protein